MRVNTKLRYPSGPALPCLKLNIKFIQYYVLYFDLIKNGHWQCRGNVTAAPTRGNRVFSCSGRCWKFYFGCTRLYKIKYIIPDNLYTQFQTWRCWGNGPVIPRCPMTQLGEYTENSNKNNSLLITVVPVDAISETWQQYYEWLICQMEILILVAIQSAAKITQFQYARLLSIIAQSKHKNTVKNKH
jgi:hypothetical protein